MNEMVARYHQHAAVGTLQRQVEEPLFQQSSEGSGTVETRAHSAVNEPPRALARSIYRLPVENIISSMRPKAQLQMKRTRSRFENIRKENDKKAVRFFVV